LLPALPDCETLCLAAKSFTNFEKLEFDDNFPKLSKAYIYASSILDKELIYEKTIAIDHCSVGDLREFKRDFCY